MIDEECDVTLKDGSSMYDFVVVGAGTAGCVVAQRLGEDFGARVLVLEAGGSDLTPSIRVPIGFVRTGSDVNWGYLPEADLTRGGVVEDWPAGRVLGGSSSINATGWIRGTPSDYAEWPSDDQAKWDFESLVPYFQRSERFDGPAGRTRGTDGRISVRYTGLSHPLIDDFIAAAQAQGHEFVPDINDGVAEGVGYVQLAQRHGWRSSSATAYLASARRHRRVTLRKHVVVERVIVEHGRAIGVEYRAGGPAQKAFAGSGIILSAGAIGSPKILKLSGIGPSEELRQHGIAVVQDMKGVGSGLQEHARVGVSYASRVPTVNQDLNPWGVLRHGADFLVRGRGAATTAPVSAVVLANREGSARKGEFQFLFAPFAVSSRTEPGAIRHYQDVGIPQDPRVSTSVWLNRPRSRGEVRLRSADPAASPVIDHQMFADSEDLADLIAGVKGLREIMRSEPLANSVYEELAPGFEVESEADLNQYVRGAAGVGHHPVGTCRMGLDSGSVVDPQLRLHGVDGLRVVDASVMPNLTSGGTYPAVVAVAEHAADLIGADLGNRP